MNRLGRKRILALTATGLLIGCIGLVGAQTTQDTQAQAATQDRTSGPHGFRPGPFLTGAFPCRGLALGTEVELTFYDANPEDGGNVLETLSFIYGEDSEVAFAQVYAEARSGAAYMTVNIGEQTRTVELAGVAGSPFGRAFGLRGVPAMLGLDEGTTIEATFYDGDPEEGGQVLESLTFVYGEDSQAGFANGLAEAAKEAAFVTITTSPQSYTVDLTASPKRFDRGAPGRHGFGPGGPFGPGRFR